MQPNYLADAGQFLVQVLISSYVILVLLRFLLQLVRADFYNPLSQFVVKLTSPVLVPMRRVIPGVAGLDTSALVLAWLLTAIQFWLILLIHGHSAGLAPLFWALPELLDQVLNIFLFAIFVLALLSWFNPGGRHPAARLLETVANPVMRPLRTLIKPVSGIDLSPLAALILIYLVKMLLVRPIAGALGSPFA